MEITYLGHASFLLKGKTARLLTDPFDGAMVGFPFPKVPEVSIVTISHEHKDHNALSNVRGNPFVIRGPGEYEVEGVSVEGFATFHDNQRGVKRGNNTMYKVILDGVTLLHAGDLGHMLDASIIDAIGDIDVVFLPVGGHFTIDAQTAAQCVKEIEPSIVIPMHYRTDRHSPDAFGMISPVSDFVAAMGKEAQTIEGKLTVKEDMLDDDVHLCILS